MSATTTPSEKSDVELGRGFAALERLAADETWEEAWRRCAWATPFQHPSWLVPWTRAFAPRDTFVVTVREGGKLAAIAPFFVIDRDDGVVALPLRAGISDDLDVVATSEAALTRARDEAALGRRFLLA